MVVPAEVVGPLAGVTVLEVGGIGPAPFAGMLLGDLGADVIRIDRPREDLRIGAPPELSISNRGKRSVSLDLKKPGGIETLLRLAAAADVLIEGFRPGVAERLGLGPEDVRRVSPRLVYGRMTGWGQTGPLAHRAGHDVDYIAITGALHAIGEEGRPPQIPLSLAGDFGGGSTYLVIGVLAGVLEARLTGEGRVVDAAIVDGTTHLLSTTYSLLNAGMWTDRRGANAYDGASPYYTVYETSDGRHMAVGAVEPQFYALLIERLGLPVRLDDQDVRHTWTATRRLIAEAFARQTQAYWAQQFLDVDACVAPVVSLTEAGSHPHLRARGAVLYRDGLPEPAPAPRFSGVESRLPSPPPTPGRDTAAVLESFGLDAERLIAEGVAFQAE
jgi:alpha-methylacyl-CoA racemase